MGDLALSWVMWEWLTVSWRWGWGWERCADCIGIALGESEDRAVYTSKQDYIVAINFSCYVANMYAQYSGSLYRLNSRITRTLKH